MVFKRTSILVEGQILHCRDKYNGAQGNNTLSAPGSHSKHHTSVCKSIRNIEVIFIVVIEMLRRIMHLT